MNYPCDDETIKRIMSILESRPEAKRVVLQFSKSLLGEAFRLTKMLKQLERQMHENKTQRQSTEFYTLFDSMKKQCCTDIIGAQHINYDILIHFGEACFSEPVAQNHFYLFPTLTPHLLQHFIHSFQSPEFIQQLINSKIKYLLTQQKLYHYAKNHLAQTLKQSQVQLLKLPFDKQPQDHYLIFGYYAEQTKETQKEQTTNLNNTNTSNNTNPNTHNNILVLFADQPQSDNKLISDIHLTKGSFSSNKSLFQGVPEIFISSLEVPKVEKSEFNCAKPLMMRLALIGELQKYDVFGLLVSNCGTGFSRRMVKKCEGILERHGKRWFVMMMNNLNEVKLGNFPEIEVYVVISCFNNSCFTSKEFYRLVVTPMDLEVGFDEVSISEYNFDLSHSRYLKKEQADNSENEQQKEKEGIKEVVVNKMNESKQENGERSLRVQEKREMLLSNTLQTLEYYRKKEYKGLDFSQKKEVERIRKGKVGLAQQYRPLKEQI